MYKIFVLLNQHMKKLDNCDFIDSARIKLFSNCYILTAKRFATKALPGFYQ
jgi:hypothetical protein